MQQNVRDGGCSAAACIVPESREYRHKRRCTNAGHGAPLNDGGLATFLDLRWVPSVLMAEPVSHLLHSLHSPTSHGVGRPVHPALQLTQRLAEGDCALLGGVSGRISVVLHTVIGHGANPI